MESVISIVLVGVMLVGALQTVGMSRKADCALADNVRGQQLALELINEIMTQEYAAPATGRVFGLEIGKSNLNRSQFTDVDDYRGWSESPPKDRSGNDIPGTTGWTRSVTVNWADVATLAATTQPDTGLKVVTVTAVRLGKTVAQVSAYRSVAWVDSIPTAASSTGNHAPTAAVVASKTSVKKNHSVTLSANLSADQDGDQLSYTWDLGDGTRGSGISIDHSYASVGTYTATLTVYDGRGGLATASVQLTVTP